MTSKNLLLCENTCSNFRVYDMLIAELKNHLLLSYNCALCNSFGANENETTIKQIITHVRHYNAFSHITHPRDWHNYQRRAISALCDLPPKKTANQRNAHVQNEGARARPKHKKTTRTISQQLPALDNYPLLFNDSMQEAYV